MITKNGSGEIAEFQGEKLQKAIPYAYEYSVYENLTEAKNSQDWPSEGAILKWINQTAERAAKANAYQKASKPLREAYEQTREFKVKNLTAAIMAGDPRKTLEDATKLAEQLTPQ